MNKIFLNEKEFNFTEDNFPILIHGEDRSGASFYTITLAVDLFLQKSKIIFLCGYPYAEEEFKKQVNINFSEDQVIFYTKEKISDFKKLIKSLKNEDVVIIVKNVELFDESIFDLISSKNKIILSGDINKCIFKNKILNTTFNTKILFSYFDGIKIPLLQKYESFYISKNLDGITKIKTFV